MKEYVSRLPCEITEAHPYVIITDFHPKTGKPWSMRQKQLVKYDDFEEDDLDKHARERSMEMQGDHA